MEVLDGFIVGIYNYCDRWCETCGLTARCRVFADRAAFLAELDPHLKGVVEAPPLPQDLPPPPARWLQDCIDEMNEAAREMTIDDARQLVREGIAPEHEGIDRRARAYSFGTAGWLQRVDMPGDRDYADPRSVLAHDCALIPAKVYRALNGWLLSQDDPADCPADHDGSAKVALLSIDRSRGAWITTAERGLAPTTEVEPFVSELGVLADELERLFPKARAFVRPGLDEPAEVAKLTE
jgi:hypothetical protein